MTTPTVVARQEDGAPLIIRILWFVLAGWWLSALWAILGWVLCVTVIGLPFGIWMLHRLPQVATLRPRTSEIVVGASGQIERRSVVQAPFVLRALYFVLVGWWLSALWIIAAWTLHATIIGMVIGFWMLDQVPGVLTLART